MHQKASKLLAKAITIAQSDIRLKRQKPLPTQLLHDVNVSEAGEVVLITHVVKQMLLPPDWAPLRGPSRQKGSNSSSAAAGLPDESAAPAPYRARTRDPLTPNSHLRESLDKSLPLEWDTVKRQRFFRDSGVEAPPPDDERHEWTEDQWQAYDVSLVREHNEAFGFADEEEGHEMSEHEGQDASQDDSEASIASSQDEDLSASKDLWQTWQDEDQRLPECVSPGLTCEDEGQGASDAQGRTSEDQGQEGFSEAEQSPSASKGVSDHVDRVMEDLRRPPDRRQTDDIISEHLPAAPPPLPIRRSKQLKGFDVALSSSED